MKITVKENSKNYACSVVEIKNLFPIEGADKIQRCNINGNDVIVSKDIKLGDKMLYFPALCKLNLDFCKFNNLFSNTELNADTNKKGYLSSNGRTKALKLRGIISDGLLMPLESLNFINK